MLAKKKKIYNPQLVKSKRSYTIKEIAQIYDLHIRTVQQWLKEGLEPINSLVKPYLIQGEDLRIFLKKRMQKFKRKLDWNEIYCTKCRCPRKSFPDRLTFHISDKKLGKHFKQAIIIGKCENCGRPLIRFSSDRIIEEMKRRGMIFKEHIIGLNGNGYCSLNTDIERKKEYVTSEH